MPSVEEGRSYLDTLPVLGNRIRQFANREISINIIEEFFYFWRNIFQTCPFDQASLPAITLRGPPFYPVVPRFKKGGRPALCSAAFTHSRTTIDSYRLFC